VIDNVVWTDSWLSNAGAGCGLTGVGAGGEQSRKVVAGEASRCGEDKLASFEGPGGQWGQVRATWWHEQQDEVMDGFWLSLKTKVEPGLHRIRVMSGDWRKLHRVCGVSSGSPENH
jgi:hypothetical protein